MNGTMILTACIVVLSATIRPHSPQDNDGSADGSPSEKATPKTVLIGKVIFDGKPKPPKDLNKKQRT